MEYHVKYMVVATGVLLAKHIRHNMGCGEEMFTRTIIEAKCRRFEGFTKVWSVTHIDFANVVFKHIKFSFLLRAADKIIGSEH